MRWKQDARQGNASGGTEGNGKVSYRKPAQEQHRGGPEQDYEEDGRVISVGHGSGVASHPVVRWSRLFHRVDVVPAPMLDCL